MTIDDLPEINFNVELDVLINDRVKLYEETYYQETSNRIVLEKNDRDRIMIKAQCLIEYQFIKKIEEQIKNNMLRYARGAYLDNLEPVAVKRFGETYAKTMIRADVAANENERIVSIGKNVTPNGSVFFENKEPVVIPANVDFVEVEFICKTPGVIGNGYVPGQITTLVESVPEFLSIRNVTTSSGGNEVEGDDPYRQRKVEGNASISVAGPSDLYVALAKSYDISISDVKPISENEGEVTVVILLKNGILPTEEFMEGLRIYMSGKDKRPMNDKVLVKAPALRNYGISLIYYADPERKVAVEKAIDDFIAYQKKVIGRSINPTKLSSYMTAAGAKVEMTLPIYTSVDELEVAVCNSKNVIYGGDIDET